MGDLPPQSLENSLRQQVIDLSLELRRQKEKIEDLKSQLATSRSVTSRMWADYKRQQKILHRGMLWLDVSVDLETLKALTSLPFEDSWWKQACKEIGWDVDWEALYSARSY